MEDYSSYIVSLNDNIQPMPNIYEDNMTIQPTTSNTTMSTNTNSTILSGNLLDEIKKDANDIKNNLLSHPLVILGGVCVLAFFLF